MTSAHPAFEIAAVLRAEIYAHARARFPEECCGYLRGPRTGTTVDEVVRCHNAQAEGAHPIAPARAADTGFVITGAELLAFARSFETERPARVLYHSHTNGQAYLSAIDREMARRAGYPVQHLVIGVTADRITEAALFGWHAAINDHVELTRWSP